MDLLTMNQSITCIKPVLSTQEAEILDIKINNLKTYHDFSVPGYCINKFIKSEMDQQSPGLRGVGRVTDETPRFGGFYRSIVNHLYKDEIIELEVLFKELIYIGYFTHAIVAEEILKPAEFEDKYKLYQMWIMYILGFDISSFSQNMALVEKASQQSVNSLKDKLHKLEFYMTDTEEEILDRILRFYGVAGFTLRRREMGIKL